jgi:hypothetical protein
VVDVHTRALINIYTTTTTTATTSPRLLLQIILLVSEVRPPRCTSHSGVGVIRVRVAVIAQSVLIGIPAAGRAHNVGIVDEFALRFQRMFDPPNAAVYAVVVFVAQAHKVSGPSNLLFLRAAHPIGSITLVLVSFNNPGKSWRIAHVR